MRKYFYVNFFNRSSLLSLLLLMLNATLLLCDEIRNFSERNQDTMHKAAKNFVHSRTNNWSKFFTFIKMCKYHADVERRQGLEIIIETLNLKINFAS